jgi:anti-anti-sigma factor
VDDPPFVIISATIGDRTEFDLRGELDLATVDVFRSAVDTSIRGTRRDVVIDLSHLTFIASPGIHALVVIQRELQRDGRRLTIICPPGPARRVLEVSGADRALELLESRDRL